MLCIREVLVLARCGLKDLIALSVFFTLFSTLSGSAYAIDLQGESLRISYNVQGNWNGVDEELGLGLFVDDDWVEFTSIGNRYHLWSVSYIRDGESAQVHSASNGIGYTAGLFFEEDLSTDDRLVARHTFEMVDDLLIEKWESWNLSESVILVESTVTNLGAKPISSVKLLTAVDPDQDYETSTSYATVNSVIDINGDGNFDWVESVGYESELVIGIASCAVGLSEYGHYDGWRDSYDAGVELLDMEGAISDSAMGMRISGTGEVGAGESLSFSFLVYLGLDELTVQESVLRSRASRCGHDLDEDGTLALMHGGDDCDDSNEAVFVGAAEVWYDGVDQDCLGGSDYDADGDGYLVDGYDLDLSGSDVDGYDCDDTDSSVYPNAEDPFYDGIDGNCDGLSDFDQDLDGFDSVVYGGEDCDDADGTVFPDAVDVWYDGVDSDCAGDNDYDRDGDGFVAVSFGGYDCLDSDSEVSPDAVEIWYDGIDQDCDGNDDDADGDGVPASLDCDDLNPDILEPCGGDTGIGKADDSNTSDTDPRLLTDGCSCSSVPNGLNLSWLITAFVVFIRRFKSLH